MAAMINLPIFLEQGVGLSTAFIGSLIFVRPGFGSIMSILIGRVMGRPEHCLTNLRIVRLGAVVALLAYICLALAAELIVAADGNPALQGALTVGCLLLQASGSFGAFLVFPSTCAHANQNDVSKFQSCMVVNCGLMLQVHSLEDTFADVIELQRALLPQMLSVEMLSARLAPNPFEAALLAHRLVGLSEGVEADEAFGRQLRRKFL